MMAVRCPACNERVEGSNSNDLSRSIKSHFSDIHNTDIDVEMNTSDEGCGCGEERGRSSEEGSSGRREEFSGSADDQRESDKPAGRPTMGMGLAPGGMVDSKEKSFEVSDTSASTGMGKFEAGIETPEGTGGSEETRGIHGFECPMCREEVKGENEEEMSAAFREHLTTTHKDEPFVTQLMEKVGERR